MAKCQWKHPKHEKKIERTELEEIRKKVLPPVYRAGENPGKMPVDALPSPMRNDGGENRISGNRGEGLRAGIVKTSVNPGKRPVDAPRTPDRKDKRKEQGERRQSSEQTEQGKILRRGNGMTKCMWIHVEWTIYFDHPDPTWIHEVMRVRVRL